MPPLSAKKAEAKRVVRQALVEMEQLKREMLESQRRSDEIAKRTGETLAYLKQKLG